jgi:hypothetical protein
LEELFVVDLDGPMLVGLELISFEFLSWLNTVFDLAGPMSAAFGIDFLFLFHG